MPEPSDPTRPTSFEAKLNAIDAQVRELEGKVELLKGIVELAEEIYTTPTPPSLDKLTEFGHEHMRFNREAAALTVDQKRIHDHLFTVSGDSDDSPDNTKRVADISQRLNKVGTEVESLRSYIFSLRPRPENPSE